MVQYYCVASRSRHLRQGDSQFQSYPGHQRFFSRVWRLNAAYMLRVRPQAKATSSTWKVSGTQGTLVSPDLANVALQHTNCSRNAECILYTVYCNNCVCSLRMWKDLNKNRLTLVKLSVSYLVSGFLSDLWPFDGFYRNRYSRSTVLFHKSERKPHGWHNQPMSPFTKKNHAHT